MEVKTREKIRMYSTNFWQIRGVACMAKSSLDALSEARCLFVCAQRVKMCAKPHAQCDAFAFAIDCLFGKRLILSAKNGKENKTVKTNVKKEKTRRKSKREPHLVPPVGGRIVTLFTDRLINIDMCESLEWRTNGQRRQRRHRWRRATCNTTVFQNLDKTQEGGGRGLVW